MAFPLTRIMAMVMRTLIRIRHLSRPSSGGRWSPHWAWSVAEIVGGLLGRSVALLNDAVHNLSDVPALGISWLAMRWAQRPADSEKTYGYHRAGTLAAFTNALVLVFLSLWLGYEAFERLRAPVHVAESWMIWTSVAALCVNGGITLALVRGRNDLNLRSILITILAMLCPISRSSPAPSPFE